MRKLLFRSGATLVSGLCLALVLSSCATGGGEKTGDSRPMVIWQSRDQFVRIVPREPAAADRGSDNDHPVTIPPNQLRRVLARPTVSGTGSGTPRPLFSAGELDLLAEHVASALQRCSSDEEIVFAVIGYHPTLMGLAKEERVTTGRFFHKGGELNLILGMVHQKVDRREDRRLAPFLPGTRALATRLEANISPGSSPSAVQLKRPDWLVFKLADEPAETVSDKNSGSNDSPPSEAVKPAEGSMEERLLKLKDLRDKDLISDDDYKATKQRILNEL